MALKTILLDPQNNYEIVENAAQMAANYNENEQNSSFHITESDQNDLNDMFLEAGLLEEHSIN